MSRVQLPTLSSTQNDWVVQQLIMNGKSTSEIALEFFERYPDYAHGVRKALSEEDSLRLMGYRVKDIRKRESDRIDRGRAELAASRAMEVPAESVPTNPESDHEWQLQNYRRALAEIQRQLAKGSWRPGELQKLLDAEDGIKSRIRSLERLSSEPTSMVEPWNVKWHPLNVAEELVYFKLTGSIGSFLCPMDSEIHQRLDTGGQVPTGPGLVDDVRQYKLPAGFDIVDALSEESKKAYEDYVRRYEETSGEVYLGGGVEKRKALEEPDYDELAKAVEKWKSRYTHDLEEEPADDASTPSAKVETADDTSKVNPANPPAAQNSIGLTDYMMKPIPKGFTEDMPTEKIRVQGRLEKFDVYCPEGCVSPDKKSGIGYVKYYDDYRCDDRFIWVRFRDYGRHTYRFNDFYRDNPLIPHSDFPKPLPTPELPTQSMPEIGYMAEDDYSPHGFDILSNHKEAIEEGERVLGVWAETKEEDEFYWRQSPESKYRGELARSAKKFEDMGEKGQAGVF